MFRGLDSVQQLRQCQVFHPGMMQKLSGEDKEILAAVKPYTMTSPARIMAVVQSVRYLLQEKVQGAFVECGVWKGGSMLAAALTLDKLGVDNRELYLFDTFTGMTKPSEEDVDIRGGRAREVYENEEGWCRAGLMEVQETMRQSSYPQNRIHYIVGDVMKTLPEEAPEEIALLRLDTDWYASTRHELQTMFPRLSNGGVLIIDDYGHWQGAKKAVDEYFSILDYPIELHPIDYSGRIAIKKNY